MTLVRFQETIDIAASRKAVFDVTQDYGNRLEWDPFLKEARLLDGAVYPGEGVKSWCVARNGFGMETVYVSFAPPKIVAIQMTKGPFFYKSFFGTWQFDEGVPGTTRATFIYSFTLRRPFIAFTPLIRSILVRDVKARLKGLKRFVESR